MASYKICSVSFVCESFYLARLLNENSSREFRGAFLFKCSTVKKLWVSSLEIVCEKVNVKMLLVTHPFGTRDGTRKNERGKIAPIVEIKKELNLRSN
jgi:hypothetical protein